MRINCLTSILLISFLHTPSVVAEDKVAKNLCQYIAYDSKKRFRGYLKTNNIKIRAAFSEVKCNNTNMLEFAASSKSKWVGAYLINRLSKKVVKENMAVIAKHSDDLAKVAKARIKG